MVRLIYNFIFKVLFIKNFRLIRIPFLYTLLVLILVAGCSTTARYRLESDRVLTQNEIAVIYCLSGTPIRLYEVDGNLGPVKIGSGADEKGIFNSRQGGAFHMELLPGRHVLKVGYYKSEYSLEGKHVVRSHAPVRLEFEALAGKVYTIKSRVWENKWEPEIVEVR